MAKKKIKKKTAKPAPVKVMVEPVPVEEPQEEAEKEPSELETLNQQIKELEKTWDLEPSPKRKAQAKARLKELKEKRDNL